MYAFHANCYPVRNPGQLVLTRGTKVSWSIIKIATWLRGFRRPFAVRLRRFFRFKQVLEFGHELADVFEIEIHGSKAHVGNFVVTAKAVHDQFANLACLPLALGRFKDESLRLVNNLLKLADGNRALFAG